MTTTTLRTRIDIPAIPIEPTRDLTLTTLSNRIPFRGPAAIRGSERARVSGRLPDWLRGDLVRVAPWFGATPHWTPAHWFDALGLVFGFELGGDEVSLRWSVLDGEIGAAAESGRVPLSHFATPNQRGPLARLLHPIPNQTDNTNVNVVRIDGEWVALTETPKQYILDPKSLAVRARVAYEDELGTPGMLAHPIRKRDHITNVAVRFGRRGELAVFDLPNRSRTRRIRARWSANELPYVHSFGLTDQTAMLVDHPLRVRPHTLLWSNRGIIEHFVWDASSPARLILLDLATGRSSAHETPPFFCFHTVHAFETPDATVLDLIAYDDASIISALSARRLAERFAETPTRLIRLSVDRRTGRVSRRVLCEVPFEFPQVDWEFAGGSPERIVFGAELTPEGSRVNSRIVRVALDSGELRSFAEADYVLGEPLFVGAPGRAREGEGVLLSVGSSERGAALFVLDATSLEELARAEVAVHLPLGFHGNFAAG